MDSRSYLVGDSRITLIFGDITASRAQVIVSSDDYLLTMGGGVSQAIHHAAGPEIWADARKLTPLKLADVAVSTAGDLPAKYVMHAVTIGSLAEELTSDAVVRQTTQRALRLATSLGCSSIAFPAIGSGTARIPFETVASQMAGALVDYLLEADPPLDVELYLMEKHRGDWQSDLWPFFETFAGRTRALETSRGPEGAVLSPPTGESEDCDGDSVADADTQRRRQVYEMLRHLDARRDALEAALLGALQGDVPGGTGTVTHIRKQLDEIKALRTGYEEELERITQPVAPVVGDSVFVSSTAVDLREHREAVRSAIDELRLKFIGMEEFAPNAASARGLHPRQGRQRAGLCRYSRHALRQRRRGYRPLDDRARVPSGPHERQGPAHVRDGR